MIAKEKCGCMVVWGFLYGVTIEYCPKHKAVDDLYEALKAVRDSAVLEKKETGFYILRLQYSSWQDACEALAKAEGK